MDLLVISSNWSRWKEYYFRCDIPTTPFLRGLCFEVEGGIAFVGYSYSFRNNHLREQAIPELVGLSKSDYISWCNQNIRVLSRLIVHPDHRGKGIGTELVKRTVGLVDVDWIECIAATKEIGRVLSRADFSFCGVLAGVEGGYWLWRREKNGF